MGRKIGSLDDADLMRINRGLLVFLRLAALARAHLMR
jgi:hypothetical protein